MRKTSPFKLVLRVFAITAVAVLALVAVRSNALLGAFVNPDRSQHISENDASSILGIASRKGPASPVLANVIPEKFGAAEDMFLDGLSKDFGAVPHGKQLSHSFPITNTHEVPITIAYLQPSCGCLKAVVGKRDLQPRESSEIIVSMDTRRFVGPGTQNVRVKVAGPDFESTCKLNVSATSQTDVAVKPNQLNFGRVTRGQTPTRTIDIEYLGNHDWKVEEVVVAKELPITTKLNELERRPGQVRYQLQVTISADAPLSVINNFIYLKTNDPDPQFVPVPVSANIRADLRAESVRK
jgi:hypothetical protein